MNTVNTQTMPAWAPAPQYVPPSLSQIKPGEPVPPAYRGGMDDIDPPSDGNAEPTPRPVESTYEIAYAYPSSDHAKKCGFAESGCFTVSIGNDVSGFTTCGKAEDFAQKTGLQPGRWSIDHPENARFNHRQEAPEPTPPTKPTSYATDGKCHNAQIGTYGHECGKPASWLGTTSKGFVSGFCSHCKEHGHEARGITTWAAIGTDTPPTPSVQKQADTPSVQKADECEDWQNIANDIPLSLAVSAFGGVSMSPDRRGLSAKNEYGQSMAADYETLHAQAVKGGTLDLLPEVFARYRARQAGSYKAYLSSSSRCASSFIAGPSNFPAARMNKRADIAHKRLNEYLDGGKMALQAAIRTLRPDLRAIMSGDADAIDRLTVELEAAERLQNQMKACNKAIRATAKMDEAHKVAALMEIGYNETQAVEILNPPAHYGRGPGFPSYRLTNNQANIRRMRARLEQITAAKARPVETVECANGVTLEDDAPANRVRLFFPGKPAEAIRDELKASGFRWAPSVGAWQAYRNHGTLATARRMAGEPLPAAPEVAEVAEVEQVEATPTVAVSTEAPTPAPVESQPEAVAPAVEAAQDAPAVDVASLVNAGFPAVVAETIAHHGIDAYGPGAQAEIRQKLADAPTPAAPTLRGEWLAATQVNRIEGKSGNWLAWFWMTSAGVIALGFSKQGQAVELNTYDTASERMTALQAMARAADAPTDTPPGGGLPCPVKTPIAHRLAVALDAVMNYTPPASEPETKAQRISAALASALSAKASQAPTPPVAQSAPGTRSAVSSEFQKTKPPRFDLNELIKRGVKPEALIGMGVYCSGDMANPAGSGAITATGNCEWYGLTVDVTLESGYVWKAVRTSEFLNGWFSLDAKFHGAPYMAELAAKVAALKASASSAEEQKATAHAKALIDLAAQYPQLKRSDSDYSGGKLAAVNARILLKAAFKGVKFSVKSDYNSLRIEWQDGPTDGQVNAIVGRFDIGASDSMTDYFYTVSTAFSKLFGGVQYMTTKRNTSDALIQQAIDKLYAKREEKPTVQDYRKCAGVFDWNGQNYENRRMRETLETISYA